MLCAVPVHTVFVFIMRNPVLCWRCLWPASDVRANGLACCIFSAGVRFATIFVLWFDLLFCFVCVCVVLLYSCMNYYHTYAKSNICEFWESLPSSINHKHAHLKTEYLSIQGVVTQQYKSQTCTSQRQKTYKFRSHVLDRAHRAVTCNWIYMYIYI